MAAIVDYCACSAAISRSASRPLRRQESTSTRPAQIALSSLSQEMTSHNVNRHFMSLLTAVLFTSRAHLLVVVLPNLFNEVDGCFGSADSFFKSKVWQSAKAVDCAV